MSIADVEAPAWFRESVERVFGVGDRVRVRLSAECRLPVDSNSVAALDRSDGHYIDHDGKRGRVVGLTIPERFTVWGHTVAVQFDESYVRHGYEFLGDFFAPTELELATSTRAHAADQEGDG